jgi:putative N6-adenine-specific DNA methylase
MNPGSFDCFAVAAPGLSPLVAEELRRLGVTGSVEDAGVGWSGGPASLYSANLWLRTATRVLVRVARFRARTFFELERHARRIEWSRWVAPGSRISFRVSCRKSRLYHSDAVAQRLGEAAARATGAEWEADSSTEDAEGEVGGGSSKKGRVGGGGGGGGGRDGPHGGEAGPDGEPAAGAGGRPAAAGARFIARFDRDEMLLSVDSSGDPLYKRGYRQAVAKAPMRETLAAAVLMASKWRVDRPIIDPFCGSGTILIEAAMMARRIAPGLQRGFAFADWPGFDAAIWNRVLEDAGSARRGKAAAAIIGSDRDAGAIEAAMANAARAGVVEDLELAVAPLSALQPPAPSGWLVTNPPYGHRVGDTRRIADLYAALGNLARERLAGWQVAVLSADRELEAQLRLQLVEELRTSNGGIPVRLLVATA